MSFDSIGFSKPGVCFVNYGSQTSPADLDNGTASSHFFIVEMERIRNSLRYLKSTFHPINRFVSFHSISTVKPGYSDTVKKVTRTLCKNFWAK